MTTAFINGAVNASSAKPEVVYLYLPNCRACVTFNHNYAELEKKYKGKYNFQKLNVMLPKGSEYAVKYGLNAFPAVLVFNGKDSRAGIVDINCMFNMACFEKEIVNFIN